MIPAWSWGALLVHGSWASEEGLCHRLGPGGADAPHGMSELEMERAVAYRVGAQACCMRGLGMQMVSRLCNCGAGDTLGNSPLRMVRLPVISVLLEGCVMEVM